MRRGPTALASPDGILEQKRLCAGYAPGVCADPGAVGGPRPPPNTPIRRGKLMIYIYIYEIGGKSSNYQRGYAPRVCAVYIYMSKLAPESYLNGGYAPGLCAGAGGMRRAYAPGVCAGPMRRARPP